MLKKFKVGDRVILKANPSCTGTVTEEGELITGVQLDDASCCAFYCNPEITKYNLE